MIILESKIDDIYIVTSKTTTMKTTIKNLKRIIILELLDLPKNQIENVFSSQMEDYVDTLELDLVEKPTIKESVNKNLWRWTGRTSNSKLIVDLHLEAPEKPTSSSPEQQAQTVTPQKTTSTSTKPRKKLKSIGRVGDWFHIGLDPLYTETKINEDKKSNFYESLKVIKKSYNESKKMLREISRKLDLKIIDEIRVLETSNGLMLKARLSDSVGVLNLNLRLISL